MHRSAFVPTVLILSTSHEEHSRSRAVAQHAGCVLERLGARVDLLDLRAHSVALYPGEDEDAARDALVERFNAADGWILATPVHNWAAAAQTFNFLNYALDRARRAYRPFVILGGAGGEGSLLALDGLGRTMMHEIQAVQVGAPILAAGASVDKSTGALTPELAARVDASISALVQLSIASAGWAAAHPIFTKEG